MKKTVFKVKYHSFERVTPQYSLKNTSSNSLPDKYLKKNLTHLIKDYNTKTMVLN
jgi:hypothetical protein